jgi:hypothetical protein
MSIDFIWRMLNRYAGDDGILRFSILLRSHSSFHFA